MICANKVLPIFIGNLQGAQALEITQECGKEFQIGTKQNRLQTSASIGFIQLTA
jgi:hypothetical protein